MDADGHGAPARASPGERAVDTAGPRRRRADPAHERQHRPAEARPADARQPVDLGRQRCAQLRAVRRRRVAVRDAAVPRARARRFDAGHAGHRRHRRRADEVQPALVLANRAGTRRDVVFGGADDSSAAAGARRRRSAAAGGRREAALHSLVQRVASAAGDARPRGGVRRAGARGLRHDRGRAPDGVESAAAGGTPPRLGRTRDRRADQHHG